MTRDDISSDERIYGREYLVPLLGLLRFIVVLFSLFCIFDYNNIVKYVVKWYIYILRLVIFSFQYKRMKRKTYEMKSYWHIKVKCNGTYKSITHCEAIKKENYAGHRRKESIQK